MKPQTIILLSAVLGCLSCAEGLIEATDSTLKAELDVITPTVGYDSEFSARLFCNSESIMIMEIMDALRAQWGVKYPFED